LRFLDPESGSNKPQMSADVPITIGSLGLSIEPKMLDVGLIAEGAGGSGKFLIKNDSAVPVVIAGVKPECGCTHVGTVDRLIPPRGEVLLPVTISGNFFQAPIGLGDSSLEKRVRISFCHENSAAYHIAVLTVTGRIPCAAMRVVPPAITFGQRMCGTDATTTVTFEGLEGLIDQVPDRIEMSACQQKVVNIVSSRSSRRLSRKSVTCSLRVPDQLEGSKATSLLLTFTEKDRVPGQLQIPATVISTGPFRVSPEILYVKVSPDSPSEPSYLTIHSTKPFATQTVHLSCNVDLSWDFLPRAAPNELRLRLRAPIQVPGSVAAGTLRLSFAKGSAAIRVPIVIVKVAAHNSTRKDS
jgi:hypothetical protein